MSHHQNCHVIPITKPLDSEALRGARSAYLAVEGLGCERCATRVRNALLQLGNALAADVVLADGMARVAYAPEHTDVGRLLAAVVACGDDTRHRYRAKLLAEGPVDPAAAADWSPAPPLAGWG